MKVKMKFESMWLTAMLVLFCSTSFGQTIQNDNELLWEISGNGLKSKSYLYGSLHSNDKRLFRLSDSTYYALEKSSAIVLETDVFSLFDEWDTRQEEVKLMFDNKGNPYTSSNEPSKTLYGNEDGMPQFLDAYFLEYCYNAGKKFFPLETVVKKEPSEKVALFIFQKNQDSAVFFVFVRSGMSVAAWRQQARELLHYGIS